MPKKGQVSVTLPESLWEKLEEYFNMNEEEFVKQGIKSPTSLLIKILRENIPWYEHYNVYEDHATIIDQKTREWIDVYFRNDRAWCEHCESFDCSHIRFLLSKEDFRKLLKEKGFKL